MIRQRERRAFAGEINVTPFVDVMLVLLIIFMVTSTVQHQGLPVELPRTRMVEALPVGKDHFVLTVLADGQIFLDQSPIPHDHVVDHLTQQVVKLKKKLYIRADAKVSHGEVLRLLAAAKQAGVLNIFLLAESEEQGDLQ